MSKLNWELNRDYEVGVDRGVFYPANGDAQSWTGLVSVSENPVEISERVRYIDGRKIANHRREDSFSATISAFSYPSSFLTNPRIPFGMSYRVETAKSYKIHLIYNVLAHISSRNHAQEQVEPINFNISTRPNAIPEAGPSAHLIVDAGVAYPDTLTQFENILYGVDAAANARLPTPQEVFDLFELNAIFKVIDNGDGTFTLEAPDEYLEMTTATLFEADWPRAVYLDEDTYRIRSW